MDYHVCVSEFRLREGTDVLPPFVQRKKSRPQKGTKNKGREELSQPAVVLRAFVPPCGLFTLRKLRDAIPGTFGPNHSISSSLRANCSLSSFRPFCIRFKIGTKEPNLNVMLSRFSNRVSDTEYCTGYTRLCSMYVLA